MSLKITLKSMKTLNSKVAELDKKQTDYQANVQTSLMDLSDKTTNEIKDLKTAFDESQNDLTLKIADMTKAQS